MALFGKNKSERIRDLENDVANVHIKFDNLKRKNVILEQQVEALQTTIKELAGAQETPERISTWGNAKTIPIQHKTYALVGANK